MCWDVSYFDTYLYDKGIDSSSEKEKSGGFRPGYILSNGQIKSHADIAIDLQNKINDFSPDLIAITALSQEFEFLLSFFSEIKIAKSTKVAIGGIHAILARDKIIETKLFDIVAFGEAEVIFGIILNKIQKGENLDAIEGTYYYNRTSDYIIKNNKCGLLSADNLWRVERDFSLLSDSHFLRPFDGHKIRRYDVETARGCPYNCAYCGNSAIKEFNKGLGSYVKTRPIISSICDMKKIKEIYNIDIFQFSDECFLSHNQNYFIEFFDCYKTNINKPFIFQTRPETVSEKKIDLLLSYGIPFQVSLGVESGSDFIMNKVCARNCTTSQVIAAFNILNTRRIRTNAFFMIGFPYEKRQDVFKTIDLCRIIKPSVCSVAIFQPLPGQKITELCIQEGFIKGNEPMATFTSHSLLKMPTPYLSSKEIRDLWRVFILYSSLPYTLYDDILKCEKDYENNMNLYEELINLRWSKYDFAKEKKDIILI